MAKSAQPRSRERQAPEFPWPAPPYFEFARDKENERWGECEIVFRDGSNAKGQLRSFLADAALLVFKPEAGGEPLSIAFSAILKLHLLQPLALRRETLPHAASAADTESLRNSERYTFRIELVNGEKFLGVTIGHVSALCGLFLFLPEPHGEVSRCFVPAQAAKVCSIDAPIGEMLIAKKEVSEEAVLAALNMQAMMRTQKLGQYLTQHRYLSPEQLSAALELKRARPQHRLGEVLVELGFMTQAELALALDEDALERTMPVGQILSRKMGIVAEQAVTAAMASKLGIPTVNLKTDIPAEVAGRIPAATARRCRAVPLCETDGALVVALENPLDAAALEELRGASRMKIMPVCAAPAEIAEALRSHYGPLPDTTPPPPERADENPAAAETAGPARNDMGVQDLISRLRAETGDLDVTEQQAVKSDSALVRLVNRIILDAVQQKASDIHVEANLAPKPTRVRFRKDGTLVNYLDLPPQFRNAVVSRIKIMSQLDITERRKPQDGKIDFARFAPAPVELRVATVPTTGGLEDVVMRVLAVAKPVPIDDLDLAPDTQRAIRDLIAKPHGLFLVCGPTGSGKTTTLHSLLAHLNTAERKIWTAEDPIEITQPGLRQVQVNAKIGWTFAAAMRSFMRADPDVIMVGEIRDAETAKIGIEASLTGHLVLSTLHTNSAPESIVRLLDLGMDPFNFADALLGVLAERLARRLCSRCKVAYEPSADELDELARAYCSETSLDAHKQIEAWSVKYGDEGKLTLYRASGCEHCDRTGYRARIGLYELLVADATTRRLVQARAPVAQVRDAAIASGLRSLRQDGIEKILAGATDLQQVTAVCS